MELRPYQKDLINKLKQALRQGYKSPVLVLGCGGGKSVICADISKRATEKHNRVLFIVHRKELVEQIQNTFDRYGVDANYCDVLMIRAAAKSDKHYSIIITDESHHSTCKSYQTIYDKHPDAIRINVTATPCRLDGRGLGETCDTIITTVTPKWLIKNKYLAPFEYYTISVADLTKLNKKHGEYEDITDLLDKPKIYGDIFKYYRQGQKAICYCSSIKHSENTAAEFNKRGISAAHIDGNTPSEERKAIIDKFRIGEIMVLCNYSILGEGFDVPDCDTVMLLRKTASLGLYIQMAMRGMRYKEGKTAYIYDFCGNAYEHGLPDEDREWTLDSKKKTSRNPSSEPDVLVRQCKNCFKTYSGTGKICPYCGADNGKTAREIEQDKRAELERIEAVERKEKRMEVGMAKTKAELVKIAKERGYKYGWVYQQMKIKGIKK